LDAPDPRARQPNLEDFMVDAEVCGVSNRTAWLLAGGSGEVRGGRRGLML